MLPQDFIDRIEQMLGEEELQEFLASYDDKRNYALRVNVTKPIDDSYFESADIPWEPSGRYYADPEVSGFRPGKHPYHECGAYYIQEASAMSPAAYLMREELWFPSVEAGAGKEVDSADRELSKSDSTEYSANHTAIQNTDGCMVGRVFS